MRTNLLGCPVDVLTMAETIELATEAMREKKTLQHVAMNVAKLVNMRSNAILREDVMRSDLIGIDGMGIVLAARLLAIPVQERVPGIDLFQALLAVCAREGFRPFLLGAKPEILQKTCKAITAQFPSIQFAGSRNGYFTPDQEMLIVDEISNSRADCLFIGMPTPKKERFLAEHRQRLSVPFIMGVGGSFDVLAGQVRRAPKSMQALGLEWLYRVYEEPRRMWWRYLNTNTQFAAILTLALAQRWVRMI